MFAITSVSSEMKSLISWLWCPCYKKPWMAGGAGSRVVAVTIVCGPQPWPRSPLISQLETWPPHTVTWALWHNNAIRTPPSHIAPEYFYCFCFGEDFCFYKTNCFVLLNTWWWSLLMHAMRLSTSEVFSRSCKYVCTFCLFSIRLWRKRN